MEHSKDSQCDWRKGGRIKELHSASKGWTLGEREKIKKWIEKWKRGRPEPESRVPERGMATKQNRARKDNGKEDGTPCCSGLFRCFLKHRGKNVGYFWIRHRDSNSLFLWTQQWKALRKRLRTHWNGTMSPNIPSPFRDYTSS